MRHDFDSWTFTASSNNLIGRAGTRRTGAPDHDPRRSPYNPSRGQGIRAGRLGHGAPLSRRADPVAEWSVDGKESRSEFVTLTCISRWSCRESNPLQKVA